MNAEASTLSLSGDHSIPMYQQIKNAISAKIKAGQWQPGDMIPSENQLAAELCVSRMTITRPLRELTADGVLRRVHGVGTFVAEPPRHASLIQLRSIADEIKQQGKSHCAEILSRQSLAANEDIAERMQLNVGTAVFHIELVHYQDGVPIQLESRFVNPDMVPDFDNTEFGDITPADYLINLITPDELEHIVQAVMPDARIAEQLAIDVDEPCLKLKRRSWKDNRIVTSVDLIYPSSRYDLGARYRPENARTAPPVNL
ncbi:MAG: histidine utilization repressor [Pseudomonadota bacterium]